MSDEKYLPAPKQPMLPSTVLDVMGSNHLPAGNPRRWYESERGAIVRRTDVIDADVAYKLARARQCEALVANIDVRIKLARKHAEVLDLPNLLAQDQREREHARDLAETKRVSDKLQGEQNLRMTMLQHELTAAQIKERIVRAERNLRAASAVSDVQVAQWYEQAAAARNEAEAVRQDTDTDLRRAGPDPDALKAAAENELARALATIEHQIELERERGNAAAVMALSNLRARLRAA